MRAEYVEAVLDVVELIPVGHVVSYGDIAVLLESGGPRQVGSVMSHHGSAVTWWRVIQASGKPPPCHDATALSHYLEEGTALRGETNGKNSSWRVAMSNARWNPAKTDFDAIDAIAARLHCTVEDAPETSSAESMSEPHGGLRS